MFNQPPNPTNPSNPTNPNIPVQPRKPQPSEPEDILHEVDPVAGGVGAISKPLETEEKKVVAKDIFSTADLMASKPMAPQALQMKKEQEAFFPNLDIERRKPLLKSKIFLTVILVVISAGILLAAGFFIYNQLNKPTDTGNGADVNDTTANINSDNINAPIDNVNTDALTTPTALPTETPIPIDTDSDGLSDNDEKMYSTDITKADTDDDGLSDRDETKTWKTDPLNPDSDNDGFKDGEEVRNKYNPLGQGRLIEIPE